MNQPIATGLENVIACDTAISHVDGQAGELVIRGRALEDLVAGGFERTCALLWDVDPTSLQPALGEARLQAHAILSSTGNACHLPDAMDGARAALGHLQAAVGAFPRDAVQVTGALGVFVAAWAARARGAEPLSPDPGATHASDVLRMILGAAASAEHVAAFETYLCCVAEHGMNASTFAARVAASTEADTVSAAIAGMSTLKGRLHGGAPGPVLDMLDAIGRPEAADPWLRSELAAGRRIMGMGHRIYRTRDPRGVILEAALGRLGGSPRTALARHVEAAAEALLTARHPQRPIRANVELFTAVLLEAVGIPRAMFTAIFATARVAGWCAHIEEQRRTGRLIRPNARYVGRHQH